MSVSRREVQDALVDQLASTIGTADPAFPFQISGRLNPNPTPPTIDIYPGEPSQERTAYGTRSLDLFFTVRARVSGDHDAGQDLLLDLMGPSDTFWLEDALGADSTLGGTVDMCYVADGPSGFRTYADAGGEGSYLGVEWRVGVTL